LSVYLKVDRKGYNAYSSHDFYGFKVSVHSPFTFPEPDAKGFTVDAGNVAYIGVDARKTESTDTVYSMGIKRRNCIKHDEKLEDLEEVGIKLEVYKNYSRNACYLECRARKLQEECKCLPYNYPNFGIAWKVDVSCDYEGLKCLAAHQSIVEKMPFV